MRLGRLFDALGAPDLPESATPVPARSIEAAARCLVAGRVVPNGDAPLLRAPFSGGECVWYRAVLYARHPDRDPADWQIDLEESEGVPFGLDDGSGELALVDPREWSSEGPAQRGARARVTVVSPLETVNVAPAVSEMPPRLQELLATRGLQAAALIGATGSHGFAEASLRVGDTVSVLGVGERLAVPPMSSGYRTTISRRVVFVARVGREGRLVVSLTGRG